MIYVLRFFDVQNVGAILRNFIVLNQPITAQSIFLIYYITLWFNNALGRNLVEEIMLVFMVTKSYGQHLKIVAMFCFDLDSTLPYGYIFALFFGKIRVNVQTSHLIAKYMEQKPYHQLLLHHGNYTFLG